MSDKTNWDKEQVLAFVHDVRPWRDMDDAEKAEWCRRVKHIRDNVVTGGEPWTNARLAVLFGLRITGLEDRFRRSGAKSDPGAQQNSWADRRTRIEEQAKAEAEAKAKAELEAEKRRAAAEATAAEARVRKEEQEKAARVKWEAEVAHRAELIRQADEAKREKLEALGRLEKQLKQEAKNQEFDVSTLNDKQRGEIMTILANDPDSADEWFDAQRQAMKRKNQEAARRAKEAMERRQFNEETQKAREAKARASREYDDSALKTLETLKDSLEDLRRTLQAKPITMDNVLVAGYSSIDPIFELADLLYDLGDLVRDNMHQLNAESELADVQITE